VLASSFLILGEDLLCPITVWLVVIVNENSLNLDNLVFVAHYGTVGAEVNVLPDRIELLAFHRTTGTAIKIGPEYIIIKVPDILVFHLWYHLCAEFYHLQFLRET
jgi:hypothetical protein